MFSRKQIWKAIWLSLCSVVCLPIMLTISQAQSDFCLLNRLPCTTRENNTALPAAGEYGIYSTRIVAESDGSARCDIRRRNHVVRKIDVIGDNSVQFIHSPGYPQENYGNQIIVLYNISCPEGHLAFFNITNIELEEPNCWDPVDNITRCVDYIQVQGGVFGNTEVCGSTPSLSSQLGQGKLQVIFRTSEANRFPGFQAVVVCFRPDDADLEGCTQQTESDLRLLQANSSQLQSDDDVLILAIQNENNCNPILRTAARFIIANSDPIKVEELRKKILSEILCQELTQPGNGSVHYSENLFHIGTVATYECNPGFIITGSVNRTCAQNLINITSTTGDWRGNSTFCEAIECPALSDLKNGAIVYASDTTALYDFGTTATHTCNLGYSLVGDEIRTCGGDGTSTTGEWHLSEPSCESVKCRALPMLDNGRILYAPDSIPDYDVGTVATYVCDRNFDLEGNVTQLCVGLNYSAIWDKATESHSCTQTGFQDVLVISTTVGAVALLLLLLAIILAITVVFVRRKSKRASDSNKRPHVTVEPVYEDPDLFLDNPPILPGRNIPIGENKAYVTELKMVENSAYSKNTFDVSEYYEI